MTRGSMMDTFDTGSRSEGLPTLPLSVTLAVSVGLLVVRGCRTWTLATKGSVALYLPCLVVDAEDPGVDVTLGLSRVEISGDVIIGAKEVSPGRGGG